METERLMTRSRIRRIPIPQRPKLQIEATGKRLPRMLAMKYGTEAVLTPIPQAMNINVLDGELMTDFDNQGTDVNGSLCGASEPAPF